MRVNYIIVSLFLFISNFSFSQYRENIQSGRPGQANGILSVGAGISQLQMGVDYSASTLNAPIFNKSHALPFRLRIGVSDKVELSFAGKYTSESYIISPSLYGYNDGFSNALAAVRVNVLEKKNYLPGVGVQYDMGLNILTGDFKLILPNSVLGVATSQKLSEKFNLITNSRFIWNGINQPSYEYVLNLSYSVNDKFSVFVEHYETVSKNSVDNPQFDGGFAYLISNDIQLDVFGGGDFFHRNPTWFISAGISSRIRYGNKKGR